MIEIPNEVFQILYLQYCIASLMWSSDWFQNFLLKRIQKLYKGTTKLGHSETRLARNDFVLRQKRLFAVCKNVFIFN